MIKEELIKHCRYYKGEKECPFENGNEEIFWDYEQRWVEWTIKEDPFLKEMENELLGLSQNLLDKDPRLIDKNKPFSLVALLFNRWGKWVNDCYLSYKGVVSDFEKWYNKNYLGE